MNLNDKSPHATNAQIQSLYLKSRNGRRPQWTLWLACALLLAGPALSGQAQDTAPKPGPKSGSEPAKLPAYTEEREAAALVFLRKHLPELAEVLGDLKQKQPGEYERAIREVFRTSEALADAREQHPDHYKIGLESWKAEMQLKLLSAKLVRAQEDQLPEMQQKLQETISKLVHLQVAQGKLQIRQGEQNLEQLRQRLEQLAAQHDMIVEQKSADILRKIEEHRKHQ